MRLHYHVRAGFHGRLADSIQVFGARGDALEWLQQYAGTVRQDGGRGFSRGPSCSGWMQRRSVHFRFGHGGAYAEISECGDEACSWLGRKALAWQPA